MYYCNWWDLNPQIWQLLDCESNILTTWLFGTMLWHLHYDIINDLVCFINIFKTRIAGIRVQSAKHFTIEPPVWRQKKSLQLSCEHTGLWLWNLYIITLWVCRFYGVMVSTLDFESSDPSSNLGRSCYFYIQTICKLSSHICNDF